MFLMIFILVLVIVFALLQNFVKDIAVFVGRKVFTLSDEELDMRVKVRDLKDEQSHVSMMDEFARYMKLQRCIDKLMTELKEGGSSRQKKMAMLNVGVKIGLHVLHALIMLCLVLSNRTEPLVMLPQGWFFPVGKLVALPTGVTGGVGIACWILVCNAVVLRGKRLLDC
ncbi:guided entry of tail-anchored proteins factor 1-like [Littorina saxatilis]|uniref:Guided entry of tail-anchored proteins factor 1 n=1 Tax=Littorina saxatilis TaxID=31220 RepID=A0AAN9BNF1_9CAEN